MGWIYENYYLSSEKNQRIRIRRVFGKWNVSVGGYDQTTSYTNKMWGQALKRLPPKFRPNKILLLGLGAGGIIPLLKKLYPQTQLTVIEWDSQMIALSKKLGFFDPSFDLNILEGDAIEVVKTLTNDFDLIVYDLFKAKKMASVTYAQGFFKNLSNLLTSSGYLLANVFSEPQNISLIDQHFNYQSTWKYKFNTLTLFQSKEAIPIDYHHHRESTEFLKREQTALDYKLTKNLVPGVSWNLGPFHFERYMSDQEPETSPGPFRMIIWQRIRKHYKPEGWKNLVTHADARRTGFVEFNRTSEYWSNWSTHAKRHRLKWLKNKEKNEWETYAPSPEEFLTAYEKHKMSPILKRVFIKLFKDKLQAQGSLLGIIGARKTSKDSPLQAALVYIDVPELSQSFHLISFHNENAKKDSVGVGLIDEWFKVSLTKCFKFLDFCIIWSPGDPKDWKGFSLFKSQFGTRYIDYPKPLFRCSGSIKKALKNSF